MGSLTNYWQFWTDSVSTPPAYDAHRAATTPGSNRSAPTSRHGLRPSHLDLEPQDAPPRASTVVKKVTTPLSADSHAKKKATVLASNAGKRDTSRATAGAASEPCRTAATKPQAAIE